MYSRGTLKKTSVKGATAFRLTRNDQMVTLRKRRRSKLRSESRVFSKSEHPEQVRVNEENLRTLVHSCSELTNPDSQLRSRAMTAINVLLSQVSVNAFASQGTARILCQKIHECGALVAVIEQIRCSGNQQHHGSGMDHGAACPNPRPDMQMLYNACSVLSHMVVNDDTCCDEVIRLGAVPVLAQQMDVGAQILEHVLDALCNIAIHSDAARDCVMQHVRMGDITRLIVPETRDACLESAVFLVGSLAQGSTAYAPAAFFAPFIPQLRIMLMGNVKNVVEKAMHSLRRIVMGTDERVVSFLHYGHGTLVDVLMVGTAAAHSGHLADRVAKQLPVNDTFYADVAGIVNAVAGSQINSIARIQLCIDSGALPFLRGIMECPSMDVVHEALLAIGNISTGTYEHVVAVLNTGVVKLVENFCTHADIGIRKDAQWCLSNILVRAAPPQLMRLVDMGTLKYVCHQPNQQNWCIKHFLKTMRYLLTCGDELSPQRPSRMAILIRTAGGMDVMIALKDHRDTEIYELANDTLSQFYETNVPGGGITLHDLVPQDRLLHGGQQVGPPQNHPLQWGQSDVPMQAPASQWGQGPQPQAPQWGQQGMLPQSAFQ